MTQRIELEVAVQSIEAAFQPLRCVVEVFDADHRLRFCVFDPNDKPVVTVEEAFTKRACDPSGLRYIVRRTREVVEKKGFKLQPWTPPPEERS